MRVNDNHALAEGKRVFDVEIQALEAVKDSLGSSFVDILAAIEKCEGKVIITGMGKPGHIAKKLVATFSSLGIPSFFLHPAEAMHGDLGMVDSDDVVIAISYSGESDEVIRIIPNIKMIGAKLIAVTGNAESTLSRSADIVQVFPPFQEACNLGLAPTSSTTAALVYGDALAVAASVKHGFREEDFGRFHPAGSLGKKLVLKVSDLMATDQNIPLVKSGARLVDAIKEMSGKKLGAVVIISDDASLLGIITDGDLRRLIEKKVDLYSVLVDEVMTTQPKLIFPDAMAIDALKRIKECDVNCLPVVNNIHLVGLITWQQIVNSGIYI